jgi:hypothetical protein
MEEKSEFDYKIGDIVTFNQKNSLMHITGEITDYFFVKNKIYLKIYSFFKRKEEYYILINDNEVVLSRKYNRRNNHDAIVYKSLFYKKILNNDIKNSIYKILAILIVLSFLIPFYPAVSKFLFQPKISYEEFVNYDLSIYDLYKIITNRIYYKYDTGEFWETPKTAWNKSYGDCEEFASICSDYLTKHKIENYLIGLNIKNSNTGHAVVFAKIKNIYYMIDLTMAVEKQGIKRLDKIPSLKEAISIYSTLPVIVYKIPAFDGDKKQIETIY